MSARPPDSEAAARLEDLRRRFGIPGLCVVLVSGEREEAICLGEDQEGSGRPVTPATWFQAASTGKHVTACVALDLAAQGRLDLAAAVGDILPDLPASWCGRSIVSLLHHTSGLPEYLAYTPGEIVPRTRREFMARAATLPPSAPEAVAWNYSNSNYILLGFIVAALTGAPCGQEVNRLLARHVPAGAIAASPDWVRAANAGETRAALDPDSLTREVFGDGDVAFTRNGALAWLRALLAGTAANGALFAPARLNGRIVPYGCGWFLERVGADDVAHHAGHYDGWTAMAYLNRSRRAGVIALTNLAPGTTRAARAIALEALEHFAPGTTPLSQHPIDDPRPELTATARAQLLRADRPVDHAAFAPWARPAGTIPGRGILNLWSGEPPAGFTLVDERFEAGERVRRYRLSYPARVEHVHVRFTADDLISWAWPL